MAGERLPENLRDSAGQATPGTPNDAGEWAAMYDTLRAIAARYLSGERPDHTLQPTALVHEAYLRLAEGAGGPWESRVHFLATAAVVMRRMLVNHARDRGRKKRGGDRRRQPLDELTLMVEDRAVECAALDSALVELAAFDPQAARIVELRFFGGLSVDEAAGLLGISARTAHRDWSAARAWLRGHLARGEGHDA